MPHVVVKMYPGTPEEQKSKLSEEITKVIMNITNKPEAAVSVAIEEVAKNEWMEKVYDTEIHPNLEKLYKKPGY
jgi:4-oxalocrotonate tautomerase